jgi:hypothetical protein
MLARLKIYKNENFNYKVLKVKLEGVKDGSELI